MRARLRAARLVGGPRDGARVDVTSGAPPAHIPGCCTEPDPQPHRDIRRCFTCGAHDDAIDRYRPDPASTTPLSYRWVSPWPT